MANRRWRNNEVRDFCGWRQCADITSPPEFVPSGGGVRATWLPLVRGNVNQTIICPKKSQPDPTWCLQPNKDTFLKHWVSMTSCCQCLGLQTKGLGAAALQLDVTAHTVSSSSVALRRDRLGQKWDIVQLFGDKANTLHRKQHPVTSPDGWHNNCTHKLSARTLRTGWELDICTV